jgi:hypothetical protein
MRAAKEAVMEDWLRPTMGTLRQGMECPKCPNDTIRYLGRRLVIQNIYAHFLTSKLMALAFDAVECTQCGFVFHLLRELPENDIRT